MVTEGYRRIQARLEVAAGDGGAGCVSIWKSAGKGKFQPADGGNGGRGGDIVVEACPRLALSPGRVSAVHCWLWFTAFTAAVVHACFAAG